MLLNPGCPECRWIGDSGAWSFYLCGRILRAPVIVRYARDGNTRVEGNGDYTAADHNSVYKDWIGDVLPSLANQFGKIIADRISAGDLVENQEFPESW